MMIDLPPVPVQETGVFVVAQAKKIEPGPFRLRERVAGACRPINYRPTDMGDGAYWPEYEGGVSPQDVAVYYLKNSLNKNDVPRPSIDAVEVLVPPQHGQVKRGTNAAGGDPRYNYVPDVDFVGQDSVVFQVTTAEGSVTVHYYLQVTDKGGDRVPWQRFCKQRFWRISLTPDTVVDGQAIAALKGQSE